MPRILSQYVAFVEAVNYRLGRIAMYGIFVMVGVLLWSSISKTFFLPSLWTLEVAQFAMVAYYILGGPYSIQMGSNVRMDLFYSPLSDRRKAWIDVFTVFFLIFFLGVLLWGGIDSTQYSLKYGERSNTVGWADVTDYFLTNNISGAWAGSFFANMDSYNALPDKLKELLTLAMDSSHYYRQWWYWGGEASLRVNGTKMKLTAIPDDEWAQVEAAAVKFWDEIASESAVKAKVVGIFKQYNADMAKAGRPYRYG